MSSRNIIREYLLGKLPAEKQEQIEERLLLDRDFFAQAMIVEDELIDEYIDSSSAERAEFGSHFFSTPQQRQKLRIAMAFKRCLSELAHEGSPAMSNYEKPKSWLRRILTGIGTQINAPRVEAE